MWFFLKIWVKSIRYLCGTIWYKWYFKNGGDALMNVSNYLFNDLTQNFSEFCKQKFFFKNSRHKFLVDFRTNFLWYVYVCLFFFVPIFNISPSSPRNEREVDEWFIIPTASTRNSFSLTFSYSFLHLIAPYFSFQFLFFYSFQFFPVTRSKKPREMISSIRHLISEMNFQ